MNRKTIRELKLTAEEQVGVEKYLRWQNERRMASRMAPFLAEVARQYPELSESARVELAETLYAKQMAEYSLKARTLAEG